jgi:hypothetical protein
LRDEAHFRSPRQARKNTGLRTARKAIDGSPPQDGGGEREEEELSAAANGRPYKRRMEPPEAIIKERITGPRAIAASR